MNILQKNQPKQTFFRAYPNGHSVTNRGGDSSAQGIDNRMLIHRFKTGPEQREQPEHRLQESPARHLQGSQANFPIKGVGSNSMLWRRLNRMNNQMLMH